MLGIFHSITAVIAGAITCLTIPAASFAQAAIAFTVLAAGGSGVTGSGNIVPGTVDTESTMNAQWQGLLPGSVHAATQYHGTSCAEHDAAPEFIFSTLTADSQGKAAAVFTVKKPFKNWPNRPHFLILHATESASSAAIACGTILAVVDPTPAPTPPATVAPTATIPPSPTTAAPAAPRAGTGQATSEQIDDNNDERWEALAVGGLFIGALAFVAGRRLR
jgi:hypothetical protein